jgi:hypothetical protein
MKTSKWEIIVLPFTMLAFFIEGGFMQNAVAQDGDPSIQVFLPTFEDGLSCSLTSCIRV